MVDYEFYSSVYHGGAIPDDDWAELEARAADQLRRYKRIYTVTAPDEQAEGNFIIDGINAFIRGVNKAFALIGALTGRSVSIDTLPRVELPRLAAGAVIPPNKEFLAVLGDQKQGTNIETPLDTMVQAFRQALSEGGYSGQSTAYLVIDEDILGKVVYRLNKSESNRVGVSLEDY